MKLKQLNRKQGKQIEQYPVGSKVKFKRSHWIISNGIIVNHTDNAKQIVKIRELETLKIFNRSLNHLDLNNN